ncbi:MAG: OmpA family protein [Candidatus Eiseniibacteriota bacterium]
MKRTWLLPSCVCAIVAALALAPAASVKGGIGDSIKKKVGDQTKKTGEAIDKAAGTGEKAASEKAGAESGSESAPAGTGSGASGNATKVSEVSTKFDFVPGDKLLFFDDFTQDELGEFPVKWNLAQGTYEVAEMNGERWLRCMSPDARIGMKLPEMAKLPEFWTLEYDFFLNDPPGSGILIRGLNPEEKYTWETSFPQGQDLAFRSGEIFSSTPLEGSGNTGRHRLMLMARGKALKVYIDRQRLANVPDISLAAGMPKDFEFRMFSPSQPMITNVRFAEGPQPAKDLLAEGKFVTYGIRFNTGSDVVLPESAPILRQVASYLEANPTVKLAITGHTDNVGTPASNLDLSKRRAASVAKVLSEQFGIAADRFTTDGKGDTQAVANNAKPEGRAMNRRVEFAKI